MIYPWSAWKPSENLDTRFIDDPFDWWMSLFQSKRVDPSVAKADDAFLPLSPRCTQFLMQNLAFSDVFSIWNILTENLEKNNWKEGFRCQLDDFYSSMCVSRKRFMLTFCFVCTLIVAIHISNDLTNISAHRVLSLSLIFRYSNNQCRLEHDGHNGATDIPSDNT